MVKSRVGETGGTDWRSAGSGRGERNERGVVQQQLPPEEREKMKGEGGRERGRRIQGFQRFDEDFGWVLSKREGGFINLNARHALRSKWEPRPAQGSSRLGCCDTGIAEGSATIRRLPTWDGGPRTWKMDDS